jgi:hypothetical protein
MGAAVSLATVLAALAAFTDLVVTDGAYFRHDPVGRVYWAPVPGALMPYAVAWVLAISGCCSPQPGARARRGARDRHLPRAAHPDR